MQSETAGFTVFEVSMHKNYGKHRPGQIDKSWLGCVVQVLRNVYPNSANVDKDLIASIAQPATHPYAAEVFYRIITGSGQSLNSLLDRIEAPLFLLW